MNMHRDKEIKEDRRYFAHQERLFWLGLAIAKRQQEQPS